MNSSLVKGRIYFEFQVYNYTHELKENKNIVCFLKLKI